MKTDTEPGRPPRWRGRAGRLVGSLAQGTETALTRFPVACLGVCLFALFSNMAVAGVELPDPRRLVWLLAALYGASAAAVATTLAAESRGWRRPASQVLSLGVALVAGAALYWGGRADSHLPALTAALTLAIPLAPYVRHGGSDRFWTFALWAAVGATLAFLSVLLFVLGLSAILEMIRFLFEAGLSSRDYEHIYTTAFTLVGPLFALGRLPRDFQERAEIAEDRLVGGVRLLVDWVAAPLALATASILHLYAAKIALTGTLPKNEIGWIVTFYALLVLALRIAAEPFLAGGAMPTRLFSRLWHVSLIVPLALGALGIAIRIGAEGVTLERYYVALAILAAALVILVQLLPGLRRDVRVMAAIPVVLLALSAFGPWGASSLVGRSQTGRIVAEFGERVPGTETIAVRSGARRPEAQIRLRSRLFALEAADRLGALAPHLEPELAERLETALRSEPEQAITIVNEGLGADVSAWAQARPRGFAALKPGEIDIGGYDRVAIARIATADTPSGDASSPARVEGMSFMLEGDDLVAAQAGAQDRFPLVAAIGELPQELFTADARETVPPVVDLRSEAGRSLRLAIRRLARDDDGAVTFLEFDACYRRSEWP
ncbi:DUF4153 domain-containing protein [Jiella avicenniae]|uniref:DUF4153 domain-containing protein n=1 Tax=Jiella avicenniae TaxID=2907202 RepID=A0A9X1P616_9HYPH|nr:DUF4153 domain-containing protein [Jiella avicenniae]MCE7029943.1 DUF4153 domain-containing protein [Jiella avicenniae]